MWRLAFVGLVASGCIGAETVECASGGVCPAGTECRIDRAEEVCVPASCGNATLEPGEDCDDGNTTSGDGCQATCRLTVRPPAREGVAVAYHRTAGQLVAVGGRNETGALGDSWAWDGRDWSELPRVSPRLPARHDAAITYDSTRGAVMMFGGFDLDGQPLDDLWTLYETRWAQFGPGGPRPSARGGAAMAFDGVRGVLVLFGGMTPTGPSDETWELDGLDWTLRAPTAAPSPRQNAAMTFDESRGEVMLVGGASDGNTWIWNGTRWATIGGAVPPSNVLGPRLAFDRARRRPVLFGSVRPSELFEYSSTWELTSAGWVEQTPASAPPPRTGFGMTYDDTLEGVMVFGGIQLEADLTPLLTNDLWRWDGVTWREYQ